MIFKAKQGSDKANHASFAFIFTKSTGELVLRKSNFRTYKFGLFEIILLLHVTEHKEGSSQYTCNLF